MTQLPRRLHLSGPARRDIAAILKRSLQEFGEAASQRYRDLISQALQDIAADPDRPGSNVRPEILVPGARIYHLAFSKAHVAVPRVQAPRHFLLYRLREDGTIEVARVVHDSRDLLRHLPKSFHSSS